MFRLIFVLLFLMSFMAGIGQVSSSINMNKINRIGKKKHFLIRKDIKKLSLSLTQNFQTDEEKALVLAAWVSYNLSYDYKVFKTFSLKRSTPEKVLLKRKGVCSEYAALYQAMCESIGIKNEKVAGYTFEPDFLPGDTIYRSNHEWNLILIDGEWKLADVTFSSTSEPRTLFIGLTHFFSRWFNLYFPPSWYWKKAFDENWVYTPPEVFIQDHLPAIADYQLLNEPVSIDSFQNAQLSTISESNFGTPTPLTWLPDVQKLELGGKKMIAFNNHNHMDQADSYLEANKLLFKEYWDKDSSQLITSNREIEHMYGLCVETDSIFKLAKMDNQVEHRYCLNRSSEWKRKYFNYNRQYVSGYKRLKRVYKKDVREIERTRKTTRKITSRIKLLQKSQSKLKFKSALRPIELKDFKELKKKQYLAYAEQQFELAQQLADRIDSLLESITPEEEIRYAETLQLELEHYRLQLKMLSKYVLFRRLYLPYVYPSDEYLQKEWLNPDYTDSLTKNTNPYPLVVNGELKELQRLIRRYHSIHKKGLKALIKVKKSAYEEGIEREMYYSKKKEHEALMSQWVVELRQKQLNKQEVQSRKMAIKLLGRGVKRLKRDNATELKRHAIYLRNRRVKKRFYDNYVRICSKVNRRIEREVKKVRK